MFKQRQLTFSAIKLNKIDKLKKIIVISLSENSTVNMEIVNVLGELVSSEIYNLNAGNNKINFNVNNVESGIYFVKLNINGLTTTKKITVSK